MIYNLGSMLNWILFNVGDPTFKNYDNITYVVKYIFRKISYDCKMNDVVYYILH